MKTVQAFVIVVIREEFNKAIKYGIQK